MAGKGARGETPGLVRAGRSHVSSVGSAAEWPKPITKKHGRMAGMRQ